jgi:hypothetical protein
MYENDVRCTCRNDLIINKLENIVAAFIQILVLTGQKSLQKKRPSVKTVINSEFLIFNSKKGPLSIKPFFTQN